MATEGALDGDIAFAISNGAYVVSTNNAGGVPEGGVLAAYRTNAASAKCSRVIATQVHGGSAPTRGYIYGASGGAYQTVGALENSSGVWQGGVPIVPGTPLSIPTNIELLALRVLHDKLPEIDDAMEPGAVAIPMPDSLLSSDWSLLGQPNSGSLFADGGNTPR